MTTPAYVSRLLDPKIPWSFRRTLDLFKTFFTGIVPLIPQFIVEQRKVDWCQLSLKKKHEVISWTRERSTLRRSSMTETAERASYVLIGVALVTGFGGNMIVAPDTDGAARLLLLLGFSKIIVSTMISILAIAFKWKVMRRPRASGESEADERLRRMVAIKEARTTIQPGLGSILARQAHKIRRFLGLVPVSAMALYEEFEEAAEQLYRRKVVLTVERRAQWTVCTIAVIGLAEVGLGMWLR
jgi:hypothetical protein